MAVKGSQYTDKGPCYSTTICTKLNVQIFENYFRTGRKDRYELMCAANAYEKKIMYRCMNMQVVAVEYQCQVIHLNKDYTQLVRKSTLLTIGFNDLK